MYKRQKKSWVKHLDFLLIDILCLEVTFFISFFIKLGENPEVAVWEIYSRLSILLVSGRICAVQSVTIGTEVMVRISSLSALTVSIQRSK